MGGKLKIKWRSDQEIEEHTQTRNFREYIHAGSFESLKGLRLASLLRSRSLAVTKEEV